MSFYSGIFCRKCSLILCFVLLCLVSYSQYDFTGVDNVFTQAKKQLGKNAVLLIYKDDKIIFKKETEEVKINTQEDIAASSKWLTVALIMTYVDQGKISLDDKVSTYLPIFEKYRKGYITIRHCLTNQTGIKQEQHKGLNFSEQEKFASLESEVNEIVTRRDIDYNPGTGFFYGTAGVDIAARVIEVVTKKNFDQLMTERILRPLMMRNTSFFNDKGINPASGAVSSAQDYGNFLAMLLNKGMFKGKKILSEQAVEEMMKPELGDAPIKFIPRLTEGFNYGLGAWIQEFDEKGKAIIISNPSFTGCWTWIDRCRGYAGIIFTHNNSSEIKREVYLNIKRAIEDVIPSNCK